MPHPLRRPSPPRPQRGIATVLIMLLVGLSLTAAVLGTASYIRDQQSQDVAAHAQTQAQMKAWTGAELVRQYLQQLQEGGQLAALYAKTAPFALTLAGSGITDAVQARVTALDGAAGTLTARITGIAASGSPAEARATLEVVYGAGTGASGAGGDCGALVRASSVLRGDVTISGGMTSFTSNGRYDDLAIDGALTIRNASEAKISGCAKGDIDLSGGGIDANAALRSQNGTIKIGSMSPPENATLWGRAIDIGNSGNGSYAALKAGAYQANVIAAGNVIAGTARAGGRLLPATAGPASPPWRTGTVVPWPAGDLLVTLADGGEYRVDMAHASVDAATGAVSGARAAASKVNTTGDTALPDAFTLRATGIDGGGIGLYTLTVGQTWGYDIAMSGYGGTYTQVWPAGDFKAVTATIATLQGGGYLWATAGGCSAPGNCWNFPAIGSGSIAGRIYYGASRTELPGTLPSVQASVPHTSPGLPGVSFCDTRTETIDVEAFRAQANYVFDFDANGRPRLSIQQVKARNGSAIDRANIDLASADPVPATAPGAMTLRRIGGADFLGCDNQQPGNQYSDALACLRSATPASGWNLNGITKFPPGIALFIGPVTIAGVASSQGTLYNTLLSTGDVELTSAGHGPLVAPNFASPLAPVCDGDFYPANLCDKRTSPSTLATWTDAQGTTHAGLPLANLAIGTNRSLSANSWSAPNGIKGNVLLGRALGTGGGAIDIEGALTVGANEVSNTTIQQGGMRVSTTNLTQDQSYLPSANCTPATPPQAISIKWSRYL